MIRRRSEISFRSNGFEKSLLVAVVLVCVGITPVLVLIHQSEATENYDRTAYPHWSAGQVWGDGLDACEEVLVDRALVPPEVRSGRVYAGLWLDEWTGRLLYHRSEIDCDHCVPLLEASRSGGDDLTRGERRALANDPANIILTHRAVNRSRGGADFADWTTPDPGAMPTYAGCWVAVKERHGLHMDVREARALAPYLVEVAP